MRRRSYPPSWQFDTCQAGARFRGEGFMLADVLDGARDRLAGELERRATIGSIESGLGERRRERLSALVQEVIEALRRGDADDSSEPMVRLTPGPDLARELRERELVQRYLLGQIQRKELEASTQETAIVTGWVAGVERKRLREQNQ